MAGTPTRTSMTVEQFFREYPDDGKQYELIDGELRELTTPNIRHQRVETRLFRLLDGEVAGIGGEIIRNVGVVVATDVVQVPDLVILLQPTQQSELDYGLVAPPDLVIEILFAQHRPVRPYGEGRSVRRSRRARTVARQPGGAHDRRLRAHGRPLRAARAGGARRAGALHRTAGALVPGVGRGRRLILDPGDFPRPGGHSIVHNGVSIS